MLQHLILKNFRSYSHKEVSFAPGLNVIKGPNGCGKTNILEALYLLSTGRSFRTTTPKQMIAHGQSHFYIEIGFTINDVEQTLSLYFDGKQKLVKHNQKSYATFSSVLGIFPMIVFTPQDIALLSGTPADRRKFINLHIAHSDPLYIHHLTRYFKALKHRNILLKKHAIAALTPFEVEMSKSSLYLMKIRKERIHALNNQLDSQRSLLQISSHLQLLYEPSLPSFINAQEIQLLFKKNRERDLLTGSTQLGTHRDDIDLLYEGKSAKHYGSEGQKRKFIAALRFSEVYELYQKQENYPLYCIDDFTAHLDPEKQLSILSHANSLPQAIVTTPSDVDRQVDNMIVLEASYSNFK